jgi:uncharacterized protein (DUF305 family)
MDPQAELVLVRSELRSGFRCAIAASLVWSSACASAPRRAADGPGGTPAATELEALYLARQDSARSRFSAADVEFVTGMIAHHAQAIVMAELAPGRAASPELGTLAARIMNAQRDEIAWMELWLRDRRQPVPSVETGGHEHLHMPGMATPEQLAELERTSGADFDRLFLTLMIAHHRGAITMVNALLATDGAVQDPATFKLASDINVDQTTEVARMEQMLAALPPGDIR